MKSESNDYVIRVLRSAQDVHAGAWNALLDLQVDANPLMRHEYLAAMQASGSATQGTGWDTRFLTLWRAGELQGACALYRKDHSYGEYVFDWAWANAYRQHGLNYYPKALVASPFTPVPGARLLARDAQARRALVQALLDWCAQERLSSLHVLFGNETDMQACAAAGMMLRHTVQFHWRNRKPGYAGFDDFLASLAQDKRKKIRQERRKVVQSGVDFRWSLGNDISAADWDFFYRCYERTYLEHGNAPYLSRDFFARMASSMPQDWLLFVAQRQARPIAASLIALHPGTALAAPQGADGNGTDKVAYGRYWGALERVDCLHFEACYYQPLQWCIEHGYQRFEGGAQGEHKMARALLPVMTRSAHWLAHPAFARAVDQFLVRESEGMDQYLQSLEQRSPLRREGTG